MVYPKIKVMAFSLVLAANLANCERPESEFSAKIQENDQRVIEKRSEIEPFGEKIKAFWLELATKKENNPKAGDESKKEDKKDGGDAATDAKPGGEVPANPENATEGKDGDGKNGDQKDGKDENQPKADEIKKEINLVFFVGFPGCPGGVPGRVEGDLYQLNRLNQNSSYDYKLIFPQFPGFSVIEGGTEKYASDAINTADYRHIEKYDAAVLKKLKEENGGKLHVYAHSVGGLRVLHAFLTLTEEERQGISVFLADPFISTEAPRGIYFMVKLLQIVSWLTPTYDWSVYNILTLPLTLFGRILFPIVNWMYTNGLKVKGNWLHLVRYVFEKQNKVEKLLSNVKDKSLNITEVVALTGQGIEGAGFGSSQSYLKYLKEKLLPKCKIDKLTEQNYGHNDFNWMEYLSKNPDIKFLNS